MLLHTLEQIFGGLLGVYLILSTVLVIGILARHYRQRPVTLEDMKHYFWIWCFGILCYLLQMLWRGFKVAWEAARPVRLSRGFRRITLLDEMPKYDRLGETVPANKD
ncbi:hypothetical protein [Marinobacterium weihaiense]|uniref:Uncharacterized protein n=1 Tax=Marinobacterium weihaiense TaxID=2851016 RepID=A0ABS6MDP2_9GAMM|nr:hypothetical protein [Marinobacterium weihaiense]MBV0934432.1 hypothetical protein [Marinobacterium weihaiense]